MGTFNSSQRNCWLVLLSQPRQPDGSFLSAETATQNALEMSDCVTSPIHQLKLAGSEARVGMSTNAAAAIAARA